MGPIKTVLVTGAAGGVGRAACHILRMTGSQVRGLARPEDNVGGLEGKLDRLFLGYVEDPRAVAAAMAGADAVVHCAALLPRDLHLGAAAFQRVNVGGSVNVLDQAEKHGLARAVFFSTISVVDHVSRKIGRDGLQDYVANPHDAYLASKIDTEKVLQERSKTSPLEIAVLRPAFIYGPGNFAVWKDALELVEAGKMKLIGTGECPLPLIYAEDIGYALAHTLDRPAEPATFRIHVVANPEPTTMRQVFDFIADYLGAQRPSTIPYWPVSLAASLAALVPEKWRRGRLRLLTKARVQQYSRGYDLTGVLDTLPPGFHPRTGYREGLARMLEDYRGQKKAQPASAAA